MNVVIVALVTVVVYLVQISGALDLAGVTPNLILVALTSSISHDPFVKIPHFTDKKFIASGLVGFLLLGLAAVTVPLYSPQIAILIFVVYCTFAVASRIMSSCIARALLTAAAATPVFYFFAALGAWPIYFQRSIFLEIIYNTTLSGLVEFSIYAAQTHRNR